MRPEERAAGPFRSKGGWDRWGWRAVAFDKISETLGLLLCWGAGCVVEAIRALCFCVQHCGCTFSSAQTALRKLPRWHLGQAWTMSGWSLHKRAVRARVCVLFLPVMVRNFAVVGRYTLCCSQVNSAPCRRMVVNVCGSRYCHVLYMYPRFE